MLATVMSETPHKQEEKGVEASRRSSGSAHIFQPTYLMLCYVGATVSGCDTHLKIQTHSHIRCRDRENGLSSYCCAAPPLVVPCLPSVRASQSLRSSVMCLSQSLHQQQLVGGWSCCDARMRGGLQENASSLRRESA